MTNSDKRLKVRSGKLGAWKGEASAPMFGHVSRGCVAELCPCMSSRSLVFAVQVSGIVGVAYSNESQILAPTLIDVLVEV